MVKLLLLAAVVPLGLGLGLGVVGDDAVDSEVVFSFADPEIVESSGLVARDGLFATVNDSGDSARMFTVDPRNGETVGVTTWPGEPTDVEALAPLPDGDVLVGDIGDNLQQRDAVSLVRVPMGEGEQEVTETDATTYELVYPDGAHDAETLLVHPRTGRVLVVAKEFIGRLYAAPEELSADEPNRLEQVGEVLPIATDGAFLPDGRHLVLRGYGTATFYAWPSLEEVGEIDLPDQEQGEGIAVDEDGGIHLSSEGQHSEVLRLRLPQRLQEALAGGPDADDDRGGETDAPVDADGSDGAGTTDERPWWPWLLGGVAGVAIIAVLLRALRPR